VTHALPFAVGLQLKTLLLFLGGANSRGFVTEFVRSARQPPSASLHACVL
jgi:hypothetical protein